MVGERTVRVVQRISAHMQELGSELDDAAREKAAVEALAAAGVKAKPEKRTGADGEKYEELNTGYLIFLSRAQVVALAEIALDIARGEKGDKKRATSAFKDDNAVAVALFGRMIAETPTLNVDAACQVSHALSVHAVNTEYDYFTAVDDAAKDDHAGATMIGTVEFVSSTLYRYATIDVDRLAENLGAKKEAVIAAVEAFVRAFLLSMPTGKQNTFANRTRPGFVLLEVREDQPVNLSAAFEEPVEASGGALASAALKLAKRAVAEDTSYGTAPVASAVLFTDPAAAPDVASVLDRAELVTIDGLVATATGAVRDRLQGE